MTSRPPGAVVWLTGIPASGKTTIARRLVELLAERGRATLWLDSDDLRAVLTPEATYTREERDRFYAALAHLAALGAEGGSVAVVSATAPRRAHRDAARDRAEPFVEAWVRCKAEVARRRDPKGLYERADRGEITTLPGAGAPYEEPASPEVVLEADREPPEVLAAKILDVLEM